MPTRTQNRTDRPTQTPRSLIDSPLRRVKDPTGRLDWVAAMVLERKIQQMGNPVLSALYAGFAPDLEAALAKYLGPRNRRMAKLRNMIREGVRTKAHDGADPRPHPSPHPRPKREWTGVTKAEVLP